MNGLKLNKSSFSLYQLTQKNINLLSPLAQTKDIQVQNNIDSAMMAFADDEMINFVIRNLLANAIKFTSAGGQIEITAETTNADVMVSVRDTGFGISSENLKKLFRHEYYSTRGTANEKGTGLGLVLCKEFLDKNAGRINVQSEVGKGSTFSFTLPRFAEKSEQQLT